MSFPRYAEYKDSGVEWLGEVPEGWEVKPIKKLGHIVSGYAFPSSDFVKEGEIRVLKISNIQTGYLDWSDESYLPKSSYIDNFSIKNGDIIFALTRPIISTGIKAAVATIAEGEIVLLNQRNALFRPFPIAERKFLYYILFDYNFKAAFENCIDSTGQQPNISPIDIGNIFVAVPPINEQTTIVAFLDQETAKMDNLINQQKKLIELLKEKRQAVISHAVTKGLNPNAPMKDSGVEWLGKVPEHWGVQTIAKATKKITNGFVGPTRDILFDEGLPYIQATHIKHGRVNFGNDYYVKNEWSNAHSKSILKAGDVLIVQTGAGTGDVGLVTEQEEGYNCHALIILQSDETLLIGSYLSLLLQSEYGKSKLESVQTGAMHPHLNCGEVKFLFTPLPPLTEQTQIVTFLDHETTKIDTLITKAESAIQLLQERRTALISAAVTGKIDVRGFLKTVAEQVNA